MKTSISLFFSDILPHKKKLYHKIVKSKIFKDKTPHEVFNELKTMGLDGFELLLPQFAEVTNSDIKEINKVTKEHKFPVLSVHQSLRFLTATRLQEIRRLFEIADKLSVKVVVLHMNSARKQIFDDEYVQTLHELEKKYKIKAAFENMEKHVESYFHSHRWHEEKFPDLIKKTGFHITFDIVHLAHSGGEILRFFRGNQERIVNIHISDYLPHVLNAVRPMKYKHLKLGDGALPIERFVSLLEKEKYNGLLTLEINTDIDGVKQSVDIIKQNASHKSD